MHGEEVAISGKCESLWEEEACYAVFL